MSNFRLVELRIVGDSLQDAVLNFDSGLNMIVGKSDTGKTYIFQCIQYMLGSSKTPKDIKESKGYQNLFLEIELDNHVSYTIKRQFHLKKIEYAIGKIEEVINKSNVFKELKQNHSAESDDNISKWLLSHIGIKGKIELKKNKNNLKRSLSFRDISHLTMIDEKTMIRDEAPIFSGQYIHKTVEVSIFKYLITQIDDSNSTTIEDPKISKSKTSAIIEYINDRKQKLESKKEYLESRLEMVSSEEDANIIKNTLDGITKIYNEKLSLRREEDKNLDKLLFSIAEANLIKERFIVLKEQYKSDISRLELNVTGTKVIQSLDNNRCPVCESDFNLGDSEFTLEDLEKHSKIEVEQTRNNLYHLDDAINSITKEIEELYSEKEKNELKTCNIDHQIMDIISPKRDKLKKELEKIKNNTELLKEQELLEDELTILEDNLLKYEKKSKIREEIVDSKDNVFELTLSKFREYFEDVLISWNLPEIKSLELTTSNFDFSINGSKFSSRGKGYKALLRSAFLFNLMKFNVELGNPHPGFIILDTPIGGLYENEEKIPKTIQDEMLSSIANSGFQIIIMENIMPKQELISKINLVEFTKDQSKGRYGFFKNPKL
ncbi:ATP-binding protein [Mycoplasmatota bacterium WC44]